MNPEVTPANIMQAISPQRSRFDVPAMVRVSASRPVHGEEITLHFVNYNREEPLDKRNPGAGIKDEKPIATPSAQADLQLPPGRRVRRIEFLTPEVEQPNALPFEQSGTRVRFRLPTFLVYGVVRVQLSKTE